MIKKFATSLLSPKIECHPKDKDKCYCICLPNQKHKCMLQAFLIYSNNDQDD